MKLLYIKMSMVTILLKKQKACFSFDSEESFLFIQKHKIEVHSPGRRGSTWP